MPYCSRCGTETNPSIQNCPLCGTPIQHFLDEDGEQLYPSSPEEDPSKTFATTKQIVQRAFLILIPLLTIPILIVLSVNIVSEGRVTWSWVPATSVVACLILVTLVFWLHGQPLILGISITVTLAILLSVLNLLIDPASSWSWSLGYPILAWTLAWIALSVLAVKSFRTPGFNVFGTGFLSVSIYCLGLDALIQAFVKGPGLSWSLIVAVALVPFAVFFFLLQYGLKRSLNIRRTFHL